MATADNPSARPPALRRKRDPISHTLPIGELSFFDVCQIVRRKALTEGSDEPSCGRGGLPGYPADQRDEALRGGRAFAAAVSQVERRDEAAIAVERPVDDAVHPQPPH